ncbi:hypothetical protein [Psychrobacter sp. FME5]|uniref:hypothetical protein n=1 Tax=Psychrobacter sp. FME5 TaxID=2487706 RepID=UPI001CE4ACB9|nr:hypothetical protein [Psychrobacter sp. FME5]
MTTISPTRVSMYDFLYQDTKPMVSLLADAAKLSIPQARLAMDASLQAIVSALLSYQQRHQGQVVSKKLFGRSAVKELRQYNSMNFATLNATFYHRHDTADAIFNDNARVVKASEHIAAQIDATSQQVQILLTSLCVIALRELAILTEYSQLDNDEINKWFALQPQFLTPARFAAHEPKAASVELEKTNDDKNSIVAVDTSSENASAENASAENASAENAPAENAPAENAPAENAPAENAPAENPLAENPLAENPLAEKPENSTKPHISNPEPLSDNPPPFDPYWYELTTFKPEKHEPVQDMQLATGNYLKAIGRSPDNLQQGRHNDMLVFTDMHAIALPHQRWLLQLAKISDIYLSRNRLRVTSEPTTPPKPPLVSLGLVGGNSDTTPTTVSEKPIEYEKSAPLWKNPVILIIIVVIGVLGGLATLKYQAQKSDGVILATEEVLEQDRRKERQQQDVAIVMMDEDEPDDAETVTTE